MLIVLALAVAAPVADEIALPQGEALAAALTEGCDPERLATMLTTDFEMYHDRAGVVARTSEGFVRQYGQDCVARQAPDAWRSRRELVATTLNVHPVPGYGAIEDGEHAARMPGRSLPRSDLRHAGGMAHPVPRDIFYERQGNGSERLAGRARFTQLWQLTPEGWRFARVFSYGHRAAE